MKDGWEYNSPVGIDSSRGEPKEKGMFKSLLTGACLLTVLAGCASAPQKQADTAAANTCLTSGSRIPHSPGECASLGQSFSGDELRQTGQINLGAALRMVDPAVQ